MSINRVIISGNLTREPDLRITQSGMPVLSLGVAVNDRMKDASGNWVDRPNYIDCTMFGTRAQKLADYLAKGSKVCVGGKLRWDQWEKDGQKRTKVYVVVDELEFMQSKNHGSEGHRGGSQKEMGTVRAEETFGVHMEPVASIYDEDIPF